MKKLVLIASLITFVSCNSPTDRKTEVLDSLKNVYADKLIHVSVDSHNIQYAYKDKFKTDIAFDLNRYQDYKLSFDEGLPFVPTTKHPVEEFTDMVKIEAYGKINKSTLDIGYISYRYILEFNSISELQDSQ